jgi:hypothetical protein
VAFDSLNHPAKPWLQNYWTSFFKDIQILSNFIVEYSEKYNYDFQFYFILFMKHIGSVILLAGIYFNLKKILKLNKKWLLFEKRFKKKGG